MENREQYTKESYTKFSNAREWYRAVKQESIIAIYSGTPWGRANAVLALELARGEMEEARRALVHMQDWRVKN
jgi:hypothetical protein